MYDFLDKRIWRTAIELLVSLNLYDGEILQIIKTAKVLLQEHIIKLNISSINYTYAFTILLWNSL